MRRTNTCSVRSWIEPVHVYAAATNEPGLVANPTNHEHWSASAMLCICSWGSLRDVISSTQTPTRPTSENSHEQLQPTDSLAESLPSAAMVWQQSKITTSATSRRPCSSVASANVDCNSRTLTAPSRVPSNTIVLSSLRTPCPLKTTTATSPEDIKVPVRFTSSMIPLAVTFLSTLRTEDEAEKPQLATKAR